MQAPAMNADTPGLYRTTAAIAKTEDAKEAQRAFAEKRAPVFVGR